MASNQYLYLDSDEKSSRSYFHFSYVYIYKLKTSNILIKQYHILIFQLELFVCNDLFRHKCRQSTSSCYWALLVCVDLLCYQIYMYLDKRKSTRGRSANIAIHSYALCKYHNWCTQQAYGNFSFIENFLIEKEKLVFKK